MPETSTPTTGSGHTIASGEFAGSDGRQPVSTEPQVNPASEPEATDTGAAEDLQANSPEGSGEKPTADLQEGSDEEPEANSPQVSDDAPADDGKPDREAAKYRRERNEARAQVERLTGIVETYQRAEVERLAAARLIDGRDVWAGGGKLADLLTDDGAVDPVKVERLAVDLAASRPHWAKRPAAPASVVTSNGKPGFADDDEKATWGGLFKKVRNGVPEEG